MQEPKPFEPPKTLERAPRPPNPGTAPPKYLFTARNARGRKRTELQEASSADELVRRLEEEGYSNIVLHTDDLTAVYLGSNQIPAKLLRIRFFLQTSVARSPLQMLKVFGAEAGRCYTVFCTVEWLSIPSAALLTLFLSVFLFLSIESGGFTLFGCCFALLLGWPIIMGLLAVWFCRRACMLDDKNAVLWRRWEEELNTNLPKLRPMICEFDDAVLTAQALAGLGRMGEALEVMSRQSTRTSAPEWLAAYMLGNVHAAAQRYDESTKCLERAIALFPECSNLYSMLALALINRHHDIAHASQWVIEAERHVVAEKDQAFLAATKGACAHERGEYALAKKLLDDAIPGMGRNATGLSARHFAFAYLAMTEAALGDRRAAYRHFKQAEPILEAQGEHELLKRCRAMLEGQS